jgi:hypothetical protein
MSTKRAYYSDTIANFLNATPECVLGILATNNDFDLGNTQRDAWLEEIRILHSVLPGREGSIYFEYSIPRMVKRIDVVLLIGPVIFVLEFKIGASTMIRSWLLPAFAGTGTSACWTNWTRMPGRNTRMQRLLRRNCDRI